MRRITAALLLTSCLAAGEMAQAQSPQYPAEPRQEYTQQPSSQDSVTNSQSKYDRKDSKESQQQKKDQAESNCAPQPKAAGEGDPDAPQNHVEYGGGG